MNDEITIQRNHNLLHSDGRMEAYVEEASRFAAECAEIATRVRAADSFLDVGCRLGYAMKAIYTRCPDADIHGVDIVPDFIDQARRTFPDTIHEAPAQSLPFGDKSFDWVFCCQVIEHVPADDFPTAVRELSRVARVGLYLSVPLEPDTPESAASNPSHHTFIPDPLAWLNRFGGDDWFLYKAWHPLPGYFNFIFLRRSWLEQSHAD